MTKTRSGDEEDNTSAPEKNIFDGKEYKWFELDELPNIPFKDFGWMWPTRDGYHVNGPSEEICIKRFVKDEESDKLKAVNEMFANLGEVYGNKPKSLSEIMFNT